MTVNIKANATNKKPESVKDFLADLANIEADIKKSHPDIVFNVEVTIA